MLEDFEGIEFGALVSCSPSARAASGFCLGGWMGCVELYAMILASQLAGVRSTAVRLRKSCPRSRIVVLIVSIPSSIRLLGSVSEGNRARMSFSGILSLPSHFSAVNHT